MNAEGEQPLAMNEEGASHELLPPEGESPAPPPEQVLAPLPEEVLAANAPSFAAPVLQRASEGVLGALPTSTNPEEIPAFILERDTGLEPATFGLGSKRVTILMA